MQGATFRLAALESSAAELPFGGERGAEWILIKTTFQGTFNIANITVHCSLGPKKMF